jgi:hypothetical protein
MNIKEPHCPVLGALEEFLCAVASATPPLYLEDANPLFPPSGKLLFGTVNIGPNRTPYSSFLLPEICSPPLGLIWPTNIGFNRFRKSIQALGCAYKPFLHTIAALEPTLQLWFPAILAHLDHFSNLSCLYLDKMADSFPSITDGTYPKVIMDLQGFSPRIMVSCSAYTATKF